MVSRIRGRLTYSNVIATIALFLAIGGGAFAASALKKNSVKSKQIAPKAVKSADIARGAVKTDKLANKSVTAAKLASGLSTQGPQGPPGPSGASIFDGSIPSGKTVTGLFVLDGYAGGPGNQVREGISFPVPAPAALEDATVGIGTGSAAFNEPTTAEIQGAVADVDEDPACTGNAGAPQAPAGRLCFYIGGSSIANVAANSVESFPGTAAGTTSFERRSGGFIRGDAAGAGVVGIRGTWAYTAP